MVGLLFRKKVKPHAKRKLFDYSTARSTSFKPPSYNKRPNLNAERSRKYYTPTLDLKYKRTSRDYRTSSSSGAEKAVIAKRKSMPSSVKKKQRFVHTRALGGRLNKRFSSYKKKKNKLRFRHKKRR